MPTTPWLDFSDVVLPSMTDIIYVSLVSGVFPTFYKSAIVKPLLKKSTLNPDDMKNYRAISNLSFMSKKVVVYHILLHLNRYKTFNDFQSSYRLGHSTETALLRVVNDLLSE